MSPTLFEHYQELCREVGAFVETPVPEAIQQRTYCAYQVHPALGSGWVDLAQIGHGMTIGRMNCAFKDPFCHSYQEPTGTLQISILLAGRGRATYHQPDRRTLIFEEGSAWLLDHRRNAGQLTRELHAGDTLQGVSIDLPAPFVEELLEDPIARASGAIPYLLKQSKPPFPERLGQFARLASAHALFCAPTRSVVDRLKMESAALDLVASLLDMRVADPTLTGIGRLPRRHRAAVDDAIAILREEFDAPHTIASLASRIGLNQCYLKAAFRTVTGTTIARYLRDIRMNQARSMIENGRHNVQETALFVGYANPSHFSAAFRKVHGMAPSELR